MDINEKIAAVSDLLGDCHQADVIINLLIAYHEDFEVDNPQRRIVHIGDDYIGITRMSGYRTYENTLANRTRITRLCAGRRSVTFSGDIRYAFNKKVRLENESEG